jgi:tRNA threonylcarbamoyladenosine biosynthesis protein TsaE
LEARQAPERLITTRSAEETRALGRSLAALLQPGDLLCLYGELGAGKTTLIQGLAQGLGVPEQVASPSFTLVHEHRGRLLLYHVDLYRIASGDLTEIGLDEVLSSEAVVAVEWAERLPRRLCEDALQIEIRMEEAAQDTRQVLLRSRGPRGRRLLQGLSQESHALPGH